MPGPIAVYSTLCETCRELFKRIAEHPDDTSPLHSVEVKFHNIQAFLSSAEDGCHLCTLIWTEMEPCWIDMQLELLVERPELAWDPMTFEIRRPVSSRMAYVMLQRGPGDFRLASPIRMRLGYPGLPYRPENERWHTVIWAIGKCD